MMLLFIDNYKFLLSLLSKTSLCFLLFFGIATLAKSQDKIITLQERTIHCTITRVKSESVEYLDPNENYGTIKKSNVKEIIFSKSPRKPIDYKNDHIKSLKVNMYALTQNALQISYEKALDPNNSIELTAKVYGISIKNYDEIKRGGALDFGYRIRLGDIVSSEKKSKFSHSLDGFSIKPTIGISYAENTVADGKNKYYYFQVGTVFNYQLVINNRMLLEVYSGFHIFKGKSTVEFPNTPPLTGVLDFQDGDLNGEDNVGVSYGIKAGYVFGSYGTESRVLRW